MPVDRPTFSETWYRVAELRPRLRSTVQARRRRFRGQTWHVLQDPATNDFFRLNHAAYQFVALLDGRHTVGEVWRMANESLGDEAPTQGEAIQLLGQLYTSNLIQAELPPDAAGLFSRYKKRRTREVQGYLTNILFARIPILDPDRFLDRWVWLFGRLFTWYGLAAWAILAVAGLYAIAGRFAELSDRASTVLDPGNLPLLYLGFLLVKVVHEFGHAFACKTFGRSGGGGEVHVMGVMLLVFTPMPYVDATSAWALRSKWHRAAVGAAGMLVELAVAAVAAMVWAGTGPGAVHAIAYNVMFVASVSTLLFNANPLLRYDGYYILSDLLEMPNLAQRSREYLYYLVRRYAWGVREARSPAHTSGERFPLAFYAVASTVYRVFVCMAILLFVADKLFILGSILAVAAVIAWVLVPLGKFVRYLFTSPELGRVRPRALGTTLAFLVLLAAGLGAIPVPDHVRIEGVVEPVDLAVIHAAGDGYVESTLPSGQMVTADGTVLVTMTNRELEGQHRRLKAQRLELEARRRLAMTQEPAAVQIVAEQLSAVDEQLRRIEEQRAALVIRSPLASTWIAPEIDRFQGAYLHRGDRLGLVASLDRVIVRATAGQDVAARLIDQAEMEVEIRLKGRPDLELGGQVLRILPAGQQQLPSASLGYAAGGSMAVSAEDPKGLQAAERFFEVHVAPEETPAVRLLAGQRVMVRLRMPSRPLAVQGWHTLLQLVQKRFHI